MTDRIAGTVLMGLDVAVEFATLGEYRLVDADASASSDDFQPAPLLRRPANLTTIAPDQKLLPPASTAIARAAAESAARVAARRGIAQPHVRPGEKAVFPSPARRRAATPALVSRAAAGQRTPAKHGPRKRGGAVEAGTQLCLFNR